MKYRKLKNVTTPQLKMEVDREYFLKLTSAIYKAKEITSIRATEKQKERMAPPDLVNVINMDTGEEMQIIVNAVLKSTLEENYPDESYVGRFFCIVKRKAETNKLYHTFSVTEVEPETGGETEVPEPAKAKGSRHR